MGRVKVNDIAPDFNARDFKGKDIQLQAMLQKGHVVLVLNRGFT
jgi:peroxiredoxin